MSTQHDTTALAGTALTVEQMMPDVAFTDAETGEQWRPSQLRQRSALVLCFLHADCRPCHHLLAKLAEREDDLRWTDAQVRVVLPEPAPVPFPVLLDPQGDARSRILGEDGQLPTLVLADRYTSVVASFPAPEHDFPTAQEILKTTRLLACDCM